VSEVPRAEVSEAPSTQAELFLLRLHYREGRPFALEGNRPILLDDPEAVYIVHAGKVDIFSVQLTDGEVTAPRRHMVRVEAGGVFFGVEPPGSARGTALLAGGVPGTQVLKLRLARWRELAAGLEDRDVVVSMVGRWVTDVSGAIVRTMRPQNPIFLEEGKEVALQPGDVAIPRAGVLWVQELSGESTFSDREDLTPIGENGFLPLTERAWLRASQPSTIVSVDTATFFERDPEWTGLTAFHRLLLEAIDSNIKQEMAVERARLEQKAASQRLVVEDALVRVASVLSRERSEQLPADGRSDPLLTACRLVAEASGIELTVPPGSSKGSMEHRAVWSLSRASGVRVREVTLEGTWWRRDNGPILAFTADEEHPVALLPASSSSYTLHDTGTGTQVHVTDEVAAGLAPFAFVLYRPFPPHALSLRELLSFGTRDSKRDLLIVLATGCAGGLLGIVTPIVTGRIVDTVIPSGDRGQLVTIWFLLFAIAIATALFQITRSIAMLRVEGRMDASLQAALWDRLLGLPVPFFRRYSAGDLGVRAMGINLIRQLLSGAVITSILGAIFSVFNLALLFYYSPTLALLACGLIAVAIGFITLTSVLLVRRQRPLLEIQGRISGLVLQIINGIAKFRVVGAENRAFALWADEFADQKRVAFKTREIGNYLAVFNAAYPIITTLTIFAAVAAFSRSSLSTGDFVAFTVAFSQVLNAGLQTSASLASILAIVPIYERAQPILQTLPEVDGAKTDPGELTGDIEVNHISFRYKQDGPTILKDLSLRVEPGRFVALVGPSGSGKSTMLRLLLGFETPESGAIYYDGQDLAGLDLRAVRRQTGTVLQNGKVMTGLLLQNIIGSSLLTVDDAWEAARMAGLEDDIKEMPMGMFTLVSEEGGTFSGGQRQRLLIARAIASKPRIIFFDEATSSLDNRTQEQVSRSLEGLHATRVVIAHRLSTIVNADYIYVFQDGQIIQQGTYTELIEQPGLFAELAKRQIA
jgi:NHLM bacteriocin system ABC transporter ATP-binding protein